MIEQPYCPNHGPDDICPDCCHGGPYAGFTITPDGMIIAPGQFRPGPSVLTHGQHDSQEGATS